jgi:hypothetical protein
MPLNHKLASDQYSRYVYCRDNGHLSFVEKAERCQRFVAGDQWNKEDADRLRAQRRPALTLNKTLITLSSILGEQIDTRTEVAYRGRYGTKPGAAETMTKVHQFVAYINQLNWQRSEVFCDGAVTSRGYYDVRMNFDNNAAGEVEISLENPKNVLPDPDADQYDPDTWNDVIVTKWYTPDDIRLLYNEEDAKALAARSTSGFAFGHDSLDFARDRIGGQGDQMIGTEFTDTDKAQSKIIRCINRQFRVLTKVKFFLDPRSGDKVAVPDSWTPEQIDAANKEHGTVVVEELAKRIRWRVTADEFVLHDDWSPYKHFTIVPYFPFFIHGRTIGLIEHILDPQELLNKSTSQELHVVNTMANSGWKVKTGALVNMELDELEERGAMTGLVLEINGDPDKDVVKIQPNQIPQGLERLSFKAEAYIKAISGRGDAQIGVARADVSGKALDKSVQSSDVTLRKAFDNLERTDYLLARNIIDLVQEFYSDPRVMNITHSDLLGTQETIEVNHPGDDGSILNDLTLGTYDVVIVSSPAKRTLEESQFDQAIGMRELGIMIPDEFIIENSNLVKKADIVKAMQAQQETPEAKLKQQVELLGGQLNLAELRAQTSKEEADALLKRAKAEKELANVQEMARTAQSGDSEIQIAQQKHEGEMQMNREKHEQAMQMKREEHQMNQDIKAKQSVEDARMKRAQAAMAMKQKPAQAGAQKQAG